jgi:type 1 fimbria pilin
MKSKASEGRRFIEVVSNCRTLFSVFVLAPLLIMPAVASANGGTLSFRGQVTNPGCSVMPLSAPLSVQTAHRVQVSGDITLAVDNVHNACTGDVIPLSTSFEQLPSSRLPHVSAESAAAEPRMGIVTVTYQ